MIHKPEENFFQEEQTQWVDETIPLSMRFNDTYYSKADGLAETHHVFLQGNDLIERFRSANHFIIAETGFGTGLNFLASLRLWRDNAPTRSRLTFTSFERYPLQADEMAKALANWPELAMDSNTLCQAWSPDGRAFRHTFDNVALKVIFGDANQTLPNLNLKADAWYLDGFAPAKNPELWNEELISAIFTATRPGGTFATYTAAGWVRRNLLAAGFIVERRPGFGTKRQMMAGNKSLINNSKRV